MSLTHSTQTAKRVVPDAAKRSSGLPAHVLIGYWHNWQNDAAPFIRLTDVADAFDVINVAFATPSKAGNGEIRFAPHKVISPQEFKNDVLQAQGRGTKVLISIGGAAGSMSIQDIAARHNFVDSVAVLIREYNFDGMDINLEGKVTLDEGDLDFRKPVSPGIVHLIMAIREIRNNFGSDFILSMAPETVNVQAGLTSYGGLSGSYLPLIHGLRDILTWLQVQHYNSGALTALDGKIYQPGTADFHVAMAELLLEGFPVHGEMFPPLNPEQVVLGIGAGPLAVENGYTDPRELQKALNYLTTGESFEGEYIRQSRSKHTSLRGIMSWSVNWDAVAGKHFSNSIRSYLDTIE